MADHEFRIEGESPVKKDLKFWSIAGHESLSRASTYELTVLSEKGDLSPQQILGHLFKVVIVFTDADGIAHERHAQGHAVRFVRGLQLGRYFRYQIRLRSWFWLLTKRRNSRILQEKKAVDILDAVFEDSPIKQFKKVQPHSLGAHEPRRYSVQFEESDYNYLSRLMEAEGIYYWFDAHTLPGTMHLADASDAAHTKLPAKPTLRRAPADVAQARFNEVTQWIDADRFDNGRYASQDVNYKAIKNLLSVESIVPNGQALNELEVFEYPGCYFDDAGMDASAKVHADELSGRRERHWATTGWPDVAVGRSFRYEGDRDGLRDGEYLIGSCVFALTHAGYEGAEGDAAPRPVAELLADVLADDAVNAEMLVPFRDLVATQEGLRTGVRGTSAFLITAFPIGKTFRPPRLTPRVVMPGPQSAICVGPEGKEFDVDDMGRVKVHFHWDRYDKSNEKSTVYIRVTQPWAGKKWGGYFAPRIGQEVIVEFMNGDPDRPIITGRVYNDDQPIPYDSPTQSGFKTRSTPGGGPSNYNEIMFEDKKGAENINIHAERNMTTTVENDDSTHVMNNQSLTVDKTRTVLIRDWEKHSVLKTQTNHVVGKQTNKYDSDTHTTTLGSQTIATKGKQDTTVIGPIISHTNSTQTVTAVGAYTQTSASLTINSAGAVALTAGGSIAMGSVADMKLTSNAARTDATVGAHSVFANAIKVVSNSNMDLMAVGNINATSNGSNTTVLGANSSGYIGVNSEANMGMARSTFMGASIDTMLGFSSSACLALQMEAAIALKLGFSGFDISQAGINMDDAGLHMFKPGAPGGGGAGAAVLGASIGAAIVAVGYSGLAAYADVSATMEQYKNAATALAEAAEQAGKLNLVNMQRRLEAAQKIVNDRLDSHDSVFLHSTAADKAAQYTGDKGLGAPGSAVTPDTGPEPGIRPPVTAPEAPAAKELPAAPADE